MGAGDVKLLMAFGALGGPSFAGEVALLGIMVGGIMAIFILISRKRFSSFINKISVFIFSLTHRDTALQIPKADENLKMPFGVAISIAAVWTILSQPLLKWGIRPW